MGLHPLQVKAKELDNWLNEERREYFLENPLKAERYKSANISQTLEADRGFLRQLVFRLKHERVSAIEEYGKFMKQIESESDDTRDVVTAVRTCWRFSCPERALLEQRLSKMFRRAVNEHTKQ